MGRFITHNFKFVLLVLKMFVKLFLFALVVVAQVGARKDDNDNVPPVRPTLRNLVTANTGQIIGQEQRIDEQAQQIIEQAQQISDLFAMSSINKDQVDKLNVNYRKALGKIAQQFREELDAKDELFEGKVEQLEADLRADLELVENSVNQSNKVQITNYSEVLGKIAQLEAKLDKELEAKDEQFEGKVEQLEADLRADLELVENPAL